MTETEVSVETTRVESETIRVCDSCGRYGDGVELVTLYKDAEATVESERFKRRTTSVHKQCQVLVDLDGQYVHGQKRDVPRHTFGTFLREKLPVTIDHSGRIDACRDCLGTMFNEDVVTPLYVEERDTDESEASESDVERLGRVLGRTIAIHNGHDPELIELKRTLLVRAAVLFAVALFALSVLLYAVF